MNDTNKANWKELTRSFERIDAKLSRMLLPMASLQANGQISAKTSAKFNELLHAKQELAEQLSNDIAKAKAEGAE